MKIRLKIALQFSIIVLIILLFFSAVIYFFTENSREERFYLRLRNRANTTARLLGDVKEIDKNLLLLIDKNSTTRLPQEGIQIYSINDSLIYTNHSPVDYSKNFLNNIKNQKEIKQHEGKKELIGLLYKGKFNDYVVVASAMDEIGLGEFERLKIRLIFGFLGGMFITIVTSIFFAKQALKPINEINQQIDNISANDLGKRIQEGNKTDEIAQLSMKFNEMLGRLQRSFEQQRDFVTHASHELRTPLASLKSEVELGLLEPNLSDTQKETLQNIYFDVERLIGLSNSILQLAKPIASKNLIINELRIDESLFEVQNDIQRRNPEYQIHIDFEQIPEKDELISIMGNEQLIRQVFINLIQNACKYAENSQVWVLIGFDNDFSIIKFKDKGIGIETDELTKIFEPFYRSKNAIGKDGFGIGLAVSKKIVEEHHGTLTAESTVGKGSCFTVKIPHLINKINQNKFILS